ncbi:STN domain-containing protein [Variovorax sp. HJSM1_2]|uniref:STN domain-containing protein n=1 Tax=Variovorax sp. HJSM1_2 TaxID=3366263 RepID=UPI003BDD7601
MLTFALVGRVALACGLALLPFRAVAATGAAHAEVQALVYFELPEQTLDKALADFSRRTGHSVLVDSVMTRSRTTQALRGDFAPQDALRQLLMGTGLSARYTGRNAFTLEPESATTNLAGSSAANDAETASGPQLPRLGGMSEAAAVDFAGALQAALTRAMCAAQPDTVGRYRAAVQLWIDGDGRVSKVRLLANTELGSRDAQLVALINGLRVGVAPPPALAQPLTILLTPRPDPAAVCREALRKGG